MVTNVQELLAFGLAGGELLASLSDGVGFDDVGKLIKCARLAAPAMKDAKQALVEYETMTDEEAKGLEDFVQKNFDIADDSVEASVKMALTVVIELHEVAKLFVKVPV